MEIGSEQISVLSVLSVSLWFSFFSMRSMPDIRNYASPWFLFFILRLSIRI